MMSPLITPSFTATTTAVCLLLLGAQETIAAPCPACAFGEYDPDLKDRDVEIPGLGKQPCSFMETATGAYLTDGTEQCAGQQAFGVYCGCPIRSDACPGLCADFKTDAVVPNFLGLGEDYKPTCLQVHSYLQGAFADGESDCASLTSAYSAVCGCGNGGGDDDDDSNGNIFNNTEETTDPTGPGVVQYESWSLCLDGSDVGYPDRDISSLWTNGANSTNSFVSKAATAVEGSVTCSALDVVTRSGLWPEELGGDTEERLILAGFCGCTPVQNACDFCPTNDITTPDEKFALTEVVFDLVATCQELDDLLTQYTETDLRCWSSKSFAFVCGCNGGTPWYLGADTERQHATLAWVPRVSGFLSFLGSVYIIQDILRQQKKLSIRGTSTYHMLLLGMSLFDISSSLAWMVSTAALPEYDNERESESGVYGARGNEATCKTQGFFLELGFVGSTAFTACLTTFYVLTIIYGYREAKMKPLQKYFMAVPTLLAVTLASAAIPYYRPFYVACFVSNPNSEVDKDFDAWRYLIIFSILPVGIAILVSVGNMFAIVRFVGKQQKIAEKWRFGNAFKFSLHPSRTTASSSSALGTTVQSQTSAGSEPLNDETTSHDETTAHEESADITLSHTSNEFRAKEVPPKIQQQPRRQNSVSNARAKTWSKTEAAVFWQAFSYVIAFLLTWVIYIIGQFKPYFSSDDESLYSFWIALLLLNPLMGFWNAFVYVKPWTWQWRKPKSQLNTSRHLTKEQQSTKFSGPNSSNSQLGPIVESEEPEEFDEEMNDTDVILERDEHTASNTEDFTPVLASVFEEKSGDISLDEQPRETQDSEE